MSKHNQKQLEKWGEDVLKIGFQQLPDILLKKQYCLKKDDSPVSMTEMVVLQNILLHWWEKGGKPFPRADELAKRLGITRRSVDRAISGLIDGGLLGKERGHSRVFYDPSPLAERLLFLAKNNSSPQN